MDVTKPVKVRKKGSSGTTSDWAFSPPDRVAADVFYQAYNEYNGYWNSFQNDPKSIPLRTLDYANRSVVSRTQRYYSAYGSGYGYWGGLGGGYGTQSFVHSFNLTAAVIDTLTAKLTSYETMAQIVTDRATAKGRRLGDDLNYWAKAICHHYNLHENIVTTYRDAMVHRAGFLKPVPDKKTGIRLERVLPDEIVVEQNDGYYNDPAKMLHRRLVSVEWLKRMYPDKAEIIMTSQTSTMSLDNSDVYTPSTLVVEGWCKNTYKDKGRHVICVQNGALVDEEWDFDYIPVEKCDYNKPLLGYWGYSVVDDLMPLQREVDTILTYLRDAFRLIVKPRIFVDRNAIIDLEQFNNSGNSIIEMDLNGGSPPIIHNGSAIPPEAFRYVEYLVNLMYQRGGVTPMDIEGQRPGDLVSSKALKTYQEIRSERWAALQKSFEKTFGCMMYKILDILRQQQNFEALSLDDKLGLKKLSTKIIPKNLRDSLIIQVFPVSSLSNTIEGRTEMAEKWLQLGVIDPRRLPDLIKLPDIGAVTMLQTSPIDYIDQSLEKMLESETYIAPEEDDDLDYALVAALQMYNFIRINSGTETQKRLLRRYRREVKKLIDQREALKMSQMAEVQQTATKQATEQMKQQQEVQKQAVEQVKQEMLAQKQVEERTKNILAARNADQIQKQSA